MRGLIFAGLFGSALAQSPVTRVVELIEGLKKEILADGVTEQKAYDEFACWCEDTLKKKATAIATAKTQIEELSTEILEQEGMTNQLTVEIKNLGDDIADNEKAREEAAAIRQNEHDSYDAARRDTESATKALKGATDVIAGATGRSLAQTVQKMSVVQGVKRALAMLPTDNQLSDDDVEFVHSFVADPAAAFGEKSKSFLQAKGKNNPFGDYAPASTQLQGILKNMYDTFVDDLQSGNTEEATKQKSYEALVRTKGDEWAQLSQSKDSKEGLHATAIAALATARQERTQSEEGLNADEAYFADTTGSCQTKADEWAERTRLRTEELAGISDAVNTLKKGAATFDESATSFFQVSMSAALNKKRAVSALERVAAATHSLQAAALAARVQATTGWHFDGIIAKVDMVIAELRAEEAEDVEHKERCLNEQSAMKAALRDGVSLKQKLSADKKQEKLLQDEATTHKENEQKTMDEITTNLKEMLTLRNEQNAAYKKARTADSQAVALIQKAVGQLMRFYDNNKLNLAATKILMGKVDPEQTLTADDVKKNDITADSENQGDGGKSADAGKPRTWKKEYGGKKSENTGVVAILQMISEDITNELEQAQREEAQSLADYSQARKAEEEAHRAANDARVGFEQKAAGHQQKVSQLDASLGAAGSSKAANEESEKALNQNCDWVKSHFDSRRTNRKVEIAGLQQAKSALQGAGREVDVGEMITTADDGTVMRATPPGGASRQDAVL